jgi:hypothetical protein
MAQTTVQAEDLVSVGSRISWGAIFAGSVLALGMYMLLSVLGGAVGLTLRDRVTEDNLKASVIVWTIIIACVSLFTGGVVTSCFTVGENKIEAVIYGILMWALTFAIVIALSAGGVHTGYGNLLRMPDIATTPSEAELATRVSWYAFGGTWISMLAAALGGLVGAGPTFRVIPIRQSF